MKCVENFVLSYRHKIHIFVSVVELLYYPALSDITSLIIILITESMHALNQIVFTSRFLHRVVRDRA